MDLREQMIEQCYSVFYQQGFHASGVELLAKQAGTTKRTLYAHFGNKEGLIEAVLNHRHQQFMAQLQQYFAKLSIITADDIVQGYLGFLQDWIRSDNFYGCLFINACAEFTNDTAMPHRIAKEHKAHLRQWLLVQFDQLNISQAQQKADTLFVFGEGLIVSAQTGQQDMTWDTQIFMTTINYFDNVPHNGQGWCDNTV